MTQVHLSFDEETLREVLLGDRGAEVLLQTVMNEILQAEMTKYLGAEPGEQTDDRRGYREILGFKIALRETAESWRELLKALKTRPPGRAGHERRA